jgi:serine/threonine-protein kinase HipA
MDKTQRAIVLCKGKRAGLLTKKAGGYEFSYDAAYLSDADAVPISLAMPLRAQIYESRALFPFFDGLLPEGWLLDLTCAAAKIDKGDKFRLLLQTGQDPVGAVSVRPAEDERHG